MHIKRRYEYWFGVIVLSCIILREKQRNVSRCSFSLGKKWTPVKARKYIGNYHKKAYRSRYPSLSLSNVYKHQAYQYILENSQNLKNCLLLNSLYPQWAMVWSSMSFCDNSNNNWIIIRGYVLRTVDSTKQISKKNLNNSKGTMIATSHEIEIIR